MDKQTEQNYKRALLSRHFTDLIKENKEIPKENPDIAFREIDGEIYGILQLDDVYQVFAKRNYGHDVFSPRKGVPTAIVEEFGFKNFKGIKLT